MASPEPKKRRTGDDLPSTAATNRFSGKVAIVTGGASGRSQLLLPIKSVLCVHIIFTGMGGVPHIIIYRLASIEQRNVVAAFLNASTTFFLWAVYSLDGCC